MKRACGQYDDRRVQFEIMSIVPCSNHMHAIAVCLESLNVATVEQCTAGLA